MYFFHSFIPQTYTKPQLWARACGSLSHPACPSASPHAVSCFPSQFILVVCCLIRVPCPILSVSHSCFSSLSSSLNSCYPLLPPALLLICPHPPSLYPVSPHNRISIPICPLSASHPCPLLSLCVSPVPVPPSAPSLSPTYPLSKSLYLLISLLPLAPWVPCLLPQQLLPSWQSSPAVLGASAAGSRRGHQGPQTAARWPGSS